MNGPIYELQVGEWKGPLEKLLELIEAEKLGINDVSLARVTDGFLTYLEEFRAAGTEGGDGARDEQFRFDIRVLADFISIASKLIFLKSKYLLPGLFLDADEEADIKDLEEKLKIYQRLKPAIKIVNRLWRESHKSFSRPYFLGRGGGLAAGQSFFYPGGTTDIPALHDSLDRLFDTVKTFELETETIKEKIVTLEEKITEVMARVQKEGEMRFRNLSNEKSRSEMIVVFLAILHLAREQVVLLEQIGNFSDIMVKKKE